MNKVLASYAIALLFFMGFMSMPVQANGIEISSNIGIYSQYVWRAIPQSNGQTSVQGDLGISESGLSISVWYATLGQDNTMEYDLILDYSGESSGVRYLLGALRYNFTHSTIPTVTEYYIGLDSGPISIKTYYDTNSKNMWTDLALEYDAAGYVVSTNLGYEIPDNGNREAKIITIGLSKTIGIANALSVYPSLFYNYAMGSNKTKNGGKGDQIIAGINFTY